MSGAAEAYDAFASIYDEFNSQNNYKGWFSVLLPEMEKHGLPKAGRLLDVGCGTGRAFEPMLGRGWIITGCDVSQEMLEQAHRKYGDRIPLSQADIRELPVLGTFDLVWALNDVVNYVTEDGDLERALAGMCANLASDGLVVFDANTFRLFELSFTRRGDGEIHDRGWAWEGTAEEISSGGTYEAKVSGPGVEPHVHRERHYSLDEVGDAMRAAGLATVAVLGQSEVDGKVVLSEPADELVDLKTIFVGRAG